MSLGSFLAKIWAGIKSLFEGLPPELKTAVAIGVTLTENLKLLIDSPVADVITALIPGDIDDQVKDLLRAKLPSILTEMHLVDATLGLTDPNAIAAAAIAAIQKGGGLTSGDAHELSILVAQVAADGKLTWSDGVYLVEWYYKNHPASPAAVMNTKIAA